MFNIWYLKTNKGNKDKSTILKLDGSPKLSVMSIYKSTWPILIQWLRVMLVRWQSDLVNTKESVRPVCDNLITRTKESYRMGRRKKFFGTVLRHNLRQLTYRKPSPCQSLCIAWPNDLNIIWTTFSSLKYHWPVIGDVGIYIGWITNLIQ